jgi:hypothetical protein
MIDMPHVNDWDTKLAEGHRDFWSWTGFDLDARLSINLGSNNDSSANSIVGAGNLNAEVNLDKIWSMKMTGDHTVSHGPGIRLGASISDGEFTAHPDLFGGYRVNLGEIMGRPDDPRIALFRLGVGYAFIDEVKTNPAASKLTALLDGNGNPEYKFRGAPAMDFEVTLPLAKLQTVRVGGRLYADMKPTPWTITLGYTIDLAKFTSGLFGAQEPAKPSTDGAKTP